MSRNIFITGTGTDVGKTYVTGLILKKLAESGAHCAYYKAAMSGNERDSTGRLLPGDALRVKQISGISQPVEEMCPYIYERAVSPHLAARIEGNPVCLPRIREDFRRLSEKHDFVVMEGSGGILCPIRRDEETLWLEDIIRELGLSSLIVADAGLGTINALLLTIHYMEARKLPIRGILLNRFHEGDEMEEDNRRVCEELSGYPVLACVAEGESALALSAEELEKYCV